MGHLQKTLHTVIVPTASRYSWDELFQARELLYAFVLRSWKVRYKQTVIGAAWAIIQPVALMVVFSVFFGLLMRVPSGDLPYPVFVYCGLLVWQFFAKALADTSNSVVSNSAIVTKIYFPRLLLPVSAAVAALPELLFSFVALAGLMLYYQIVPGWEMLLVPLFVAVALVVAFGVGAMLGAVYVLYRDIAQLLPFLTQLWMFMTPIIYPASLVPEAFRWLYQLNPMVLVVEGARWAFAGSPPPNQTTVILGLAMSVVFLYIGIRIFQNLEPYFSETI